MGSHGAPLEIFTRVINAPRRRREFRSPQQHDQPFSQILVRYRRLLHPRQEPAAGVTSEIGSEAPLAGSDTLLPARERSCGVRRPRGHSTNPTRRPELLPQTQQEFATILPIGALHAELRRNASAARRRQIAPRYYRAESRAAPPGFATQKIHFPAVRTGRSFRCDLSRGRIAPFGGTARSVHRRKAIPANLRRAAESRPDRT